MNKKEFYLLQYKKDEGIMYYLKEQKDKTTKFINGHLFTTNRTRGKKFKTYKEANEQMLEIKIIGSNVFDYNFLRVLFCNWQEGL